MVRHSLLLLMLAMCAGAAPPARFGRIDVYSVDGAFDVRDVVASPGAQIMDVRWRGEQRARSGATAQARVREAWREIWLEVVPEKDGKLELHFQGEFYRQNDPTDVRRVWVDSIRVTGAALVNGDLDALDEPTGLPSGWRFTGPLPPDALSKDGSIAHTGRVCAAAWFGAQLCQTVAVQAGKPVRVSAMFRATGPEIQPPHVREHKQSFDELLELHEETITVTCLSDDLAQRTRIQPLPLYDGAEWAVTSRWDDNLWTNLKTRTVLLEYGHRGTFFLNDPQRNAYGNDYGLMQKPSFDKLGATLSSGGTTIGGHSLTHPMLSYQNRNRILEEVLGCRIALEARFDTLVNAYAFSFCNYRSSIEGQQVQLAIATALGRAGYLQIANHRFATDGCWPWGVAGLLPPDGRPIERAFAGFLADDDLKHENPAITYSMHSWYDTPEEWTGFAEDLNRYGGRKNWWYCNHNEYGAYRAQFSSAQRGTRSINGAQITYRFSRPSLLDLNDTIPLTFEISGVRQQDVVSVTGNGSDLKIEAAAELGERSRPVRFHLPHPARPELPKTIDHIRSDGRWATSQDFPSVSALLTIDGTKLTLQLKNAGTAAIRVHRVTHRLPLLYRGGVVFQSGDELARGQSITRHVELDSAHDDARYRAGQPYFSAQIDLSSGDTSGRIYVTTCGADAAIDPAYPGQGFTVLGPVPRDQVDLPALDPMTVASSGWTAGNGEKLTFEKLTPPLAGQLNVEVVPVRGRWDNQSLTPCVYFLRSTIVATTPSDIAFVHDPQAIPAVWLAGKRVGERCSLVAGDNVLVLAYVPPVDQRFAPEHAGPMLRAVDADTRERVTTIRYRQ